MFVPSTSLHTQTRNPDLGQQDHKGKSSIYFTAPSLSVSYIIRTCAGRQCVRETDRPDARFVEAIIACGQPLDLQDRNGVYCIRNNFVTGLAIIKHDWFIQKELSALVG